MTNEEMSLINKITNYFHTIDEAIKHEEELVNEYEGYAKKIREKMKSEISLSNADDFDKYARQYRQLLEWLKELKSYKEDKDIISIFDGATNEDVLRKVFPNFEEDITPKGDTLILERYTPYCKMQLHKDWLDASYKGGKE